FLRRSACAAESGAGIADVFENFGFVGGEAFDGLYQVRDEVGTALQGDIHGAPGCGDGLALGDEIVTHADELAASAHAHEEANSDDEQGNFQESSRLLFI